MLKSNINDDDIKTFDDLVNDKTILKNELANSCYFNIIYNVYCVNFNKNSKYKNISQIELANIFGVQYGVQYIKQNLGISIIESVRFFEKYKIGLKVFNIFKNVIYEYKPITYNAHVTPQTLYILVHNQHCWTLHDDPCHSDINI